MDFMDVTKASPTTASVPRLRLAKVDWKINDSNTSRSKPSMGSTPRRK